MRPQPRPPSATRLQAPLARPAGLAIRHQLLWLAAGVVLLSGGLVGTTLFYLRGEAMAAGERLTESFTHVIEEQTSRTFQAVDQRLQLAANGLAQLQASGHLDAGSADALLREQIRDLPFVNAIWVLDAQGRLTHASGTRRPGYGTDFSDRDYFKIYLTRPTTALHIAAPLRSRFGGTWLISAARPLRKADGSFAGIIVAGVEPSYFDKLWRSVELGPGGTVTLWRLDNVLMMRSPLDDATMGKAFPDAQLPRRSSSDPTSGRRQVASVVDGQLRLYAYRALTTQPDLTVAVGRSVDLMLAPWHRLTILALTVWALVSAAVALLCLSVIRAADLRRRAEAERLQAERRIQAGQQSLRDSAQHTQTILDNMADCVITIDLRGQVESFNKAASTVFGYAPDEVQGRNVSMLMAEPHRSHHDQYLQHYQDTGDSRIIGRLREVEGRRKDGSVFPMNLSVSKIVRAGQTSFIGIVRDITQQRRDVEEIRRLAFYDLLTGLPNRRLLMDRLKQAMTTSARNGHHGALMFLDLDHFKQLNDTLGHDVGDILLQQVAGRLQDCVREGDSVARLGGDEFVVLLEALSPQAHEAANQAEAVASKILAAFDGSFILRGTAYESTPSIGIVVFLGDEQAIDDLLKRADVAMYQAKAAGRNTARFFDPAMQATVTARDALERDLRRGFAQREFVLHYQVQVTRDGRAVGAEALVRWQHETRGLVPPGEFIALAEQVGLILPLGQWVLETACAQLRAWSEHEAQRHWTMAVNLSASQLVQPDFVARVAEALHKTGANPHLLKLELTESMLVNDVEDAIVKMNAIKAYGVGFSLDDFGTGYSSLSYLKRLPLDLLKIDRSFVRDVLHDPSDAVIARTIVALGHSLGLKIMAEGVETAEQRDFLASAGCDGFQGYFFGRPQPEPELELRC